jgi:hypothetical protein
MRAIASLSTAPGFLARHDNDVTLRVVKRLQHGADVPTPVVTPEGRLLWGEVVVAAHHVNQTTFCLCKVVSCSKEELAILRKLDDAKTKKRRIRTGLLVAHLVTLTEQDVLKAWAQEGTELRAETLRQQNVRGVARNWVGDILGIPHRTMRTFDAQPRLAEKSKREPEPEWELRCHDWQPAPGLLEEARTARIALRNMDLRLRNDQRELGPLMAHPTALPDAQRLYNAAHKLAALARSLLPEHLCPYCKSTVAVRPTCMGCKGAGWVSQEVWSRTPEELLTAYLVYHGGHLLDPLTMQPPRRIVREKYQSAQFVGDLYEEEEEPAEVDEDQW